MRSRTSRSCCWFTLVLGLVLANCLAKEPQPEKPPTKANLIVALAQADRLVVTAPMEKEARFEITAPGIGDELLAQIAIDESAEWFHCMCHGDAWITAYAGAEKRATIGFHHARSLRWIGGPWTSDALLSGDAGIKLSQWFAKKGFPLFEERRLAEIARAEAEEAKDKAFNGQLSPGTLAIIEADGAGFRRETTFAQRALRSAPDRAELAASVFRAFGQLPPKNTGYNYTMSVCRKIIEVSAGADLEKALRLVERDTRQGLKGAAFLFCATPYHSKLSDPAADEWGPKLAAVVLRSFDDDLKPDALRRLISISGPQVDAFLVAVASGEQQFPYAAHLHRSEYDEEPELISAACLVLAMRHHSRATALAEAALRSVSDSPSKAALEVALALAGNRGALRPEVFKLKSFLIGFGAMQVLEEAPSDRVSARLIGAALDAPWGAVRERAERLAFQLGVGPAKKPEEHNYGDIEIDKALADEAPADAVAIYSGQLDQAIGVTKADLLRTRASAYAALGKLEMALDDLNASQKIHYSRDAVRSIATTLWQAGRPKEAVDALSRSFPMSDPWDLEVRGLARLCAGEFDEAERDLAASVLIDSRGLYRQIFHHLAANLNKHPELSRLADLESTALAEKDDWSRTVASFLLDRLAEEKLFESAKNPRDQAEAYYYAAQIKRLAGNLEAERALLTRSVAMQQFRLTEHWLAKARLHEFEKSESAGEAQ